MLDSLQHNTLTPPAHLQSRTTAVKNNLDLQGATFSCFYDETSRNDCPLAVTARRRSSKYWHCLFAGPLGQCHPIPDDPQLKAEMLKHARNYQRIHRMYNLPYQSEPGSDMAKVAKYPPVTCQPLSSLKACVYAKSVTAVSH